MEKKIEELLKNKSLKIRRWRKQYQSFGGSPGESKAAKIARVLEAGHEVELTDLYAGGDTWTDPEYIDPEDGAVTYALNKDNIDEFLAEYKL